MGTLAFISCMTLLQIFEVIIKQMKFFTATHINIDYKVIFCFVPTIQKQFPFLLLKSFTKIESMNENIILVFISKNIGRRTRRL